MDLSCLSAGSFDFKPAWDSRASGRGAGVVGSGFRPEPDKPVAAEFISTKRFRV